jgi:PepB aminopeptidase
MTLHVELSKQAAGAAFGERASLSFGAHGATIHAASADRLRVIQGAARRLAPLATNGVRLSGPWDLEAAWAFTQGMVTAKQPGGPDASALTEADRREFDARLNAATWLRRVINAAPEDLFPEQLCVEAITWLQGLGGRSVSARIIKGDALLAAGHIGTHTVGRASVREPCVLELDFNPGAADAPISTALVGKGITFDSGGYSIKASESMLTMKYDMGGAATVAAGLGLAILRGLNQRVSLTLCCAENLISGNAYKLGDILRYPNGVSVEIVNTDAEGRLVLADGLQRASASGAKQIIDAATLTGAAQTAVGREYHAIFALDGEARERYLRHAQAEFEPHWALPLEPWHRDMCPSPYADTANSRPVKGGGPGGASNAAGFLSRFVRSGGAGWVHVDLAAAFTPNDSTFYAAGATALGIRTIARALTEA